MNYEKLVKALRSASTISSAWEKLMLDAAAAIEELQAEVKRLDKHDTDLHNDGYDVGYWAGKRDHEPKWGEWKEVEDFDCDIHYQCSVCGEEWYFIDGTPKDNNANFCPQCGAKMEVQE